MKLKYDATDYTLRGTSEVLTERYPDLTDADHQVRQYTALHEAAHLITALTLPTGWVGTDAIVRVPRVPAGLRDAGNAMGAVHAGARGWEHAIACFAGVAATFISDDPRKEGCSGDVYTGMKIVCELAGTRNTRIIYDVRWTLLFMAVQTVVRYWPVIDLTATALLLNARMGGGIAGKHFKALVAVARDAATEADSHTIGYPREVSFPVASAVNSLIEKRRRHTPCKLKLPRSDRVLIANTRKSLGLNAS